VPLAASLGVVSPAIPACTPQQPAESAGQDTAPASAPVEETIVFANAAFYCDRPEPERTVRGVLLRVDVITGPDTREHPARLRTDAGEWGVYVAGLPEDVLDAIIGEPAWVTGKWIPADAQNPVEEVWIARVRRDRRDGR